MTSLTVNKFNNRNLKKLENPNIKSKQYINKGRTKDCQTPYRNPINHWRKTTTCGDCNTNEKILVDNFALSFGKSTCYYPYVRNILNKDGIRKNTFLFSSLSLRHKKGITYEQNTLSNIYDYRDLSNNNTYPITNETYVNGSNNYKNDCQRTVIKFKNRNFYKNTAVSGRNRIQRLKYNTILKASANNALNGDLISIQGVSHNIVPPYRNNKNIDSFEDNPNCGKKNPKISCSSKKKGSDKDKKFYFAKKEYVPPSYFQHNLIFQPNKNGSNGNGTYTNGSSSNGSSSNGSSSNGSSSNGSSSNGSSSNGSSSNGSSSNGSSSNGSSSNGYTY